MTYIATHISSPGDHTMNQDKLTRVSQRILISAWVILALFLMSSLANAMDTPTTITQQGVFTIIQSPTQTVVCTRMGNMVNCQ